MKVLNTHRMNTPNRTIDLAPGVEPETFAKGEPYTLTPMVRIIADEGKLLANGSRRQSCVIAENAEGWEEIDDPQYHSAPIG